MDATGFIAILGSMKALARPDPDPVDPHHRVEMLAVPLSVMPEWQLPPLASNPMASLRPPVVGAGPAMDMGAMWQHPAPVAGPPNEIGLQMAVELLLDMADGLGRSHVDQPPADFGPGRPETGMIMNPALPGFALQARDTGTPKRSGPTLDEIGRRFHDMGTDEQAAFLAAMGISEELLRRMQRLLRQLETLPAQATRGMLLLLVLVVEQVFARLEQAGGPALPEAGARTRIRL